MWLISILAYQFEDLGSAMGGGGGGEHPFQTPIECTYRLHTEGEVAQ